MHGNSFFRSFVDDTREQVIHDVLDLSKYLDGVGMGGGGNPYNCL